MVVVHHDLLLAQRNARSRADQHELAQPQGLLRPQHLEHRADVRRKAAADLLSQPQLRTADVPKLPGSLSVPILRDAADGGDHREQAKVVLAAENEHGDHDRVRPAAAERLIVQAVGRRRRAVGRGVPAAELALQHVVPDSRRHKVELDAQVLDLPQQEVRLPQEHRRFGHDRVEAIEVRLVAFLREGALVLGMPPEDRELVIAAGDVQAGAHFFQQLRRMRQEQGGCLGRRDLEVVAHALLQLLEPKVRGLRAMW
mmetsp:Transcript_69734/g.136867  ORF Transcript_69734/g.136867 Transcript_69734/m.136867 type:complete len:256 (-) Transcript_69734:977-1744(-)